MNIDNSVVFEYEQILLGNAEVLNQSIQNSDNDVSITQRDREYAVIVCLKYVIEDLLHWTPEDAMRNLTEDLLVMFKLRPQLDKTRFRKLPISAILRNAYNDRGFERTVVLYDYMQTAGLGEFKNDQKPRIAKNLFIGQEGKRALHIIMCYLINNYMSDESPKELYDFFGNDRRAAKWISKYKLELAKDVNKINGLKMFHFYGPEDKRDDFFYYSKLIENSCNEELKKMKQSV